MDKVEVLKMVMDRWRKDRSLPARSDAEIKSLADMCTEAEFEAGKVIEIAGNEAKNFYIITEGMVSISVDMGRGRERQIQTASSGEIVGWSALVPPYRYRGYLRAIEKTKVLVFSGEELRKLHTKNLAMAYALYVGITGVLAERLHNTFLQLVDITS